MNNAIELQVISKILTTDDDSIVDRLCAFDSSYYAVLTDQIEYIQDHKDRTRKVPDLFTFQAQFEDIVIVAVNEPVEYLEDEMRKNKQQILLLQTFNKLADLGSGDVVDAWEYLNRQCELASELDVSRPVDIIKDAQERASKIIEYNKQARIPTGFKEIDEVMYGGLSTVEELLCIVARTNSGKSWVCTKLMESAQEHNFPVLYYSPEMQSSFIGTRFDTWRGHFKNSDLHRGIYSDEYKEYLGRLSDQSVGSLVVEDSDMPENKTTVKALEVLVKRNNIKLLIIDGLSYIAADKFAPNESVKYRDICNDLFKLSKTYGCAVVIAVQANRETRDNRDENGEPFPNLYNLAESDHPARIATQVFALRQLYEQHIIELRLEKSRNARNEKPVFGYVVDFNTGSLEYVASNASGYSQPVNNDSFQTPIVTTTIMQDLDVEAEAEIDEDDFADVSF